MKTSTASLRSVDLKRIALVAFATVAVTLAAARVHAGDPAGVDAIALTAPVVRIVEPDAQTGASVARVSVVARVHVDPATLTTASGEALLRQEVLEAAAKACAAVLSDDYDTCVRDAIASARPQVDAAISRAKRTPAGS